jgi:rubredoxin---NAD+ reductase
LVRLVNPVVIVGSGLAGYAVAKELRRLDQAQPIVVLTRDDGSWYSKPMLSNALAAGKTADALASSTAAQMSKQLGIEVRTQLEVTRVLPESRELRTAAGALCYSSLVLAVGADPVPLEICGALANCYAVNDLADYARLRRALESARRVAILGGGLIGCEFANDLVAAGYAATVIEPGEWPLSRLVPEAVGRVLQEALAGAGVDWRLGRVARRAEVAASGTRLHLSDGEIVEADIVLSAVGLRPRTELARATGVDVERGIVTDRFLETSEARIYALGDCAQVNGRHLPYVLPLIQCARALAKTLAGERTAVSYPAMPVIVKTPALPVTVAAPEADVRGMWHIEGEGRDVAARYMDMHGELAGFALTGVANGRKAALVRELNENLQAESDTRGHDTAVIATPRS